MLNLKYKWPNIKSKEESRCNKRSKARKPGKRGRSSKRKERLITINLN
jgi:hypothetical protein